MKSGKTGIYFWDAYPLMVFSTYSNLLMMDTPPKQPPIQDASSHTLNSDHPLMNSHLTPVNLDLSIPDDHMAAATHSVSTHF